MWKDRIEDLRVINKIVTLTNVNISHNPIVTAQQCYCHRNSRPREADADGILANHIHGEDILSDEQSFRSRKCELILASSELGGLSFHFERGNACCTPHMRRNSNPKLLPRHAGILGESVDDSFFKRRLLIKSPVKSLVLKR